MPEQVTPASAAVELLARREARRDLLAFTTYTKPDFQVGEHHRQIAEALQSVEAGECDRLMIFAPPRHTKSELASRRFPAWYLGRHPDHQLICSTYSGDFALDFGRDVRSIVKDARYRNLFPELELSADSQAANAWRTTKGGISVYVGVGGPLTGRGAHCFVAGTQVETQFGTRSIESLDELMLQGARVLSHGKRGPEYKRVEAFAERQGGAIYRITSAAGRVLEVTADHLVWSAGAYVCADDLRAGDRLLTSQYVAGSWSAIDDSVALVERVCEAATVYDVQVADNHNLFANGILAHNCALIDDPFKNRQEADSENQRDLVWAWYSSTLRTRLMPGGSIVVINTRWHEDDLCGRLLKKNPDEWKVIELQAIKDEGTPHERALWPAWYPLAALKRVKADTMPRDWSALYQQRPSPDEGTYFQRDWFQTWEIRPKFLNIYGTSDYAVTDEGGDFTVHRIWGVDQNGYLYRLGGWRGQTTSDVWIERQIDLIQTFKPFAWFGESGVIQKAIEPMLRRRMREREAYCRMEWLSSIHDKPTRARGFQARAAMKRVWFERGADIEEFLRFPAGKNDDDVDCASLIGRALDEAHPAIVVKAEKEKYVDRWDQAFNRNRETDEDWKVV